MRKIRIARGMKVLALGGLAAVIAASCSACATTGAAPSGSRLERVAQSPRYRDGKFHNELPRTRPDIGQMLWKVMFEASDQTAPVEPPPVVARRGMDFFEPPKSGLRVTWFGHSSFLIEIDGYRVLVDPIWSERASPVGWIGPSRFHRPPLPLEELPPIDAVIISHDHYDHLDHATIVALAQRPNVVFAVPLGVGAHLEHWGVPPERIHDHDWWAETKLDGLTLTAVPSRHFSGRSPLFLDEDRTLWAGWVVRTDEHRVYFSGDTAMFPGFAEIGERLGPFDVAMIETGAYDPLWADVHLGPEQAVVAAQMVRAKLYMPVHWGTFDLALHSWTEPIERVLEASARVGVKLVAPRPGQSFEPAAPPALVRWWPDTEWERSGEKLVMSSGLTDNLQAAVRRAHGLDTIAAFEPPM